MGRTEESRGRTARARGVRLGVAVAALLASSAIGCRSSVPPVPVDQDRAYALLRSFTTREQLTDFLAREPATCIDHAPGRVLCEWVLGDRDPAWVEVARAIDSRDRVGVLCDLPTSGAPREVDSCSLHPRRSSRNLWRAQSTMKARRTGRRGPSRAELREAAQALLDEAKTLPAMSRLMGAAPDRCFSAAPQERACEWHANNHVYGHGVLAASREERMSRKMILRCAFPQDGTPRASDSCYAGVGR